MLHLDKAKEPTFWENVRSNGCFKGFREELLEKWREYGDETEIPTLRYRDFKLFEETGNRSAYEAPYFKRRTILSVSAILSLIYPDEPKYFEGLLDIIFTICDEYTWALPAHLAHINDEKSTRIELFAAGTALSLVEIYTLLYDRLPDLIRERVEKEIDRRILSPYLATSRYYWEYCTNNWAAVCLSGVAAVFMLLKPEKARELIPRFEETMAKYLSGFLDDGVCLEGGMYWDYGFGHFLVYADYIEHFSGGKINHFKNPKVKEIAFFPQRAYLGAGKAVGFADAYASFSWETGRMHYLKSKYPEITLFPEKYSVHTYSRFYSLLRDLMWYNESYENEINEEKVSEYFAPLSEWYVRKSKHYSLAAKGGNNDEPHNHNDVGSFIFLKNGAEILADLGKGEYTRQYFSEERYEILEPSSRSHSVPILDGRHQLAGKEHKAEDFLYKDGTLSFDFSSAYGLATGKGVKRSFTFTESTVTLTDCFGYEGEITERLVSCFEPQLVKDGVIDIKGARILFDASAWSVSFGKEERTLKRGEYCYFLDFKPKNNEKRFSCTLEA